MKQLFFIIAILLALFSCKKETTQENKPITGSEEITAASENALATNMFDDVYKQVDNSSAVTKDSANNIKSLTSMQCATITLDSGEFDLTTWPKHITVDFGTTGCQGNDYRVRKGKILYTGVSNWSAWQIAKALGISERKGFARFECIQPMYNLVKRQVEVEILPLAKEESIGVITYHPLGAGLLTGKYKKRDTLIHGRLMENKMFASRFSDPTYYEIAEKFVDYAKANGLNPSALAVAWVMSNTSVTAPILGARNLTQLEQVLASLEIQMTPEIYQEISSLSISPPVATDRTEKIDNIKR